MTLLSTIDQTITATPTLWWLGQAGFVVRFASITFYVDPCFTELPLAPADVTHADMILATSAQYVDASIAAHARRFETREADSSQKRRRCRARAAGFPITA